MRVVAYVARYRGPFEPGIEYRNPTYFDAPLGNPSDVIIVGDWPRIAEAYAAQGARIHQLPAGCAPRLLGSLPEIPGDLAAQISPPRPDAEIPQETPDPAKLTPPPPVQALDITRETIAKMPKGAVAVLLAAHGIDTPPAKVGDMRALLTRILFVDA